MQHPNGLPDVVWHNMAPRPRGGITGVHMTNGIVNEIGTGTRRPISKCRLTVKQVRRSKSNSNSDKGACYRPYFETCY